MKKGTRIALKVIAIVMAATVLLVGVVAVVFPRIRWDKVPIVRAFLSSPSYARSIDASAYDGPICWQALDERPNGWACEEDWFSDVFLGYTISLLQDYMQKNDLAITPREYLIDENIEFEELLTVLEFEAAPPMDMPTKTVKQKSNGASPIGVFVSEGLSSFFRWDDGVLTEETYGGNIYRYTYEHPSEETFADVAHWEYSVSGRGEHYAVATYTQGHRREERLDEHILDRLLYLNPETKCAETVLETHDGDRILCVGPETVMVYRHDTGVIQWLETDGAVRCEQSLTLKKNFAYHFNYLEDSENVRVEAYRNYGLLDHFIDRELEQHDLWLSLDGE